MMGPELEKGERPMVVGKIEQLNNYASLKPSLAKPLLKAIVQYRESRSLAFEKALENLINEYSKEDESNTPDFLLAQYIMGCLGAYNRAVKARDIWYDGKVKEPAQL